MFGVEILFLLSGSKHDDGYQLPEAEASITIPVVPCYAVAAGVVLISSEGDWTLMVVWVEVELDLVLLLRHPVDLEDVQQLHSFSDVDELTLVDAKDLQVAHHGYDQLEDLGGQKGDTVKLEVLEVVCEVVERKTYGELAKLLSMAEFEEED